MKYTSAVIIFIFLFVLVRGQTQFVENAQTYIPESLIQCYKNQSLRNPENRLPMTIETFIDLVRKVESFQKGTEDVSSLATSMLHRFRLDGIRLHTDVRETEGVVPYSVSGKAFFKHRIVLKYLVPSNNLQFPNESLSLVEQCTLHFMLSHTIEKSVRGDESALCGRLQNYQYGRSNRIPRDARYRRQIEEEEEEKVATTSSVPEDHQPLLTEPVEENEDKITDDKLLLDKTTEKHNEKETTTQQVSPIAIEKIAKFQLFGFDYNWSDIFDPETDDHIFNHTLDMETDDHNFNHTLDKEIDDHNLNDTLDTGTDILNTPMKNQSKSGKIIFDDDIYVGAHYEPAGKPKKLINANLMPEEKDTTQSIDVPGIRPRVANIGTESDCPVECGVVKTRWGSVSLGTVLAGIAAGSFAQQIQVQKLVLGGARAQTLSNDVSLSLVDNKFAATLIGDLSEATLEQGPKGEIKVGTAGGWNDTVYSKWYFNRANTDNEMTDAEIRGGLDGLIMGTQIQTWKALVATSRGVLKLSQLLDMYYSEDGVFDEKYRACDRKTLFPEVAPITTMQEQAFRFTAVLDQHSVTSASMDEARIQQFSANSVSKLMSYLPQMIDEVCTKTTSTSSVATKSPDLTRITPYVNLTVVIDSRWNYVNIRNILFNLMQKLNLGEFGSKVTVIDGKNRVPYLVDAIYTTDVETNFTENNYNTHESGMDIPRALEQELKASMQGILADEDKNNVAGGRSTIILFIPTEAVSLNQNDLTIAKNQIRYFRENIPDVKFLYLAPGNKENYRDLVDDMTTDVITYTSINSETEIPPIVDQVIDRIKKVPIRLSNPTCGSDWSANSYNLAELTYSVKQFGVNYHRLHANYLFGVGTAEVKIEGITSGILKACFSRKNQFPDSNSTSNTETQCQQINGDSYTYKLSNPCQDFDYISQCPPLYVSVASVSKVQIFNCVDCQYPHNVKYKISNLGLVCHSGMARVLGNSIHIVIAAASVIVLKNLMSGR